METTAPTYYRLVNTVTNKVMKLTHNETDMKTVIEDVLLYASIDKPEAAHQLEDFPKLLDECHIKVESSPEPFVYEDQVLATYHITAPEKPEPYKPKGRVYSSNMLNYL